MNFRRNYNSTGLKVPASLPKRGVLCVSSGFQAPPELLLDGYCTPVEDQGSKPWCAAYSATSFAENVLWRTNGRRRDVDPAPVYAYAKTIDGDPDGDGTYLECALKGLIHVGAFEPDCRVRTFGNSWFGFGDTDAVNETKYAIHRYGCCVAGFSITDEWFSPAEDVIRGGAGFTPQGGHAVLLCGYDEGGFLIMNSWGRDYGHDGKVYVSNEAFRKQFMYAAVLTHCLDDGSTAGRNEDEKQ